jgi:hypothetical protein
VDVCNHEHWGLPTKPVEFLNSLGFDVGELARYLGHIHSIEFLNSLCVIHKQQPLRNVLGLRSVKGSLSVVCAVDVKLIDGQQQPAPNEEANSYRDPCSTRLQPTPAPAKELELQDFPVSLRRSLAFKDQELVEQALRLQHHDRQINSLRRELIRAEAQLKLLRDLWIEGIGKK